MAILLEVPEEESVGVDICSSPPGLVGYSVFLLAKLEDEAETLATE